MEESEQDADGLWDKVAELEKEGLAEKDGEEEFVARLPAEKRKSRIPSIALPKDAPARNDRRATSNSYGDKAVKWADTLRKQV